MRRLKRRSKLARVIKILAPIMIPTRSTSFNIIVEEQDVPVDPKFIPYDNPPPGDDGDE